MQRQYFHDIIVFTLSYMCYATESIHVIWSFRLVCLFVLLLRHSAGSDDERSTHPGFHSSPIGFTRSGPFLIVDLRTHLYTVDRLYNSEPVGRHVWNTSENGDMTRIFKNMTPVFRLMLCFCLLFKFFSLSFCVIRYLIKTTYTTAYSIFNFDVFYTKYVINYS